MSATPWPSMFRVLTWLLGDYFRASDDDTVLQGKLGVIDLVQLTTASPPQISTATCV